MAWPCTCVLTAASRAESANDVTFYAKNLNSDSEGGMLPEGRRTTREMHLEWKRQVGDLVRA